MACDHSGMLSNLIFKKRQILKQLVRNLTLELLRTMSLTLVYVQVVWVANLTLCLGNGSTLAWLPGIESATSRYSVGRPRLARKSVSFNTVYIIGILFNRLKKGGVSHFDFF